MYKIKVEYRPDPGNWQPEEFISDEFEGDNPSVFQFFCNEEGKVLKVIPWDRIQSVEITEFESVNDSEEPDG